jgi:hypothetical protein
MVMAALARVPLTWTEGSIRGDMAAGLVYAIGLVLVLLG